MNDLSKLTDAQLSAVFAQEVAGWKLLENFGPKGQLHSPKCSCFDGAGCMIPRFTTSLDALMPFVRELLCAEEFFYELTGGHGGYEVRLLARDDPEDSASLLAEVNGSSAARCTATALLLWKRAQKGVAA